MPGHCPASGSAAACGPPRAGAAWSGGALPGGGGLGGLVHLAGQLVVGVGGLQAPLAGGAGLVGAVGAGLGPVALVFGGFVQRGEQGLDLGRPRR